MPKKTFCQKILCPRWQFAQRGHYAQNDILPILLRVFVVRIFWNTVPTHINLRRFIKIWGFQGGGLLKILPIKASKSLKKWTFGPKKWWFIQILLYWRFNQEWRFICVDMVNKISSTARRLTFFELILTVLFLFMLHA